MHATTASSSLVFLLCKLSEQSDPLAAAAAAAASHRTTAASYRNLVCIAGYIGEFEYVDDHRGGKIVVELNGRSENQSVALVSTASAAFCALVQGWHLS